MIYIYIFIDYFDYLHYLIYVCIQICIFLRMFSYVEVLHIHRYILTIQHVHQFFFIIFVIIKELMKQPGICMSVFIIKIGRAHV